jgi:Amidohydrolase family
MLCALALFSSAIPLSADAQIAAATRTVAITGATVVPSPGQVLENATVIIRDGLITDVGVGVAVPYDARVVKADSMFVYAGFIDPLSHVGQEAPRQPQGGGFFGGGGGGGGQGQQPVPDRGNPPFDRAGLEPYRQVRDLLDPEHDSVSALRDAGFTAAHAVPRGRMLPGSGAVVLLHGSTADAMVLSSDVSFFAQFQAARGMYPGTPMAMTAKMRQLYREADRRHGLTGLYEDDPSGMTRPPVDPVHSAFFPVIEGEKVVFFHVTDALEAHRALKLREDLGFRLVLTGLSQGYDLAEKLANSGVSLAVTTHFPDKPGWMASLKRDSLQILIDDYDPDTRTATWRDTEAEIRSLEARQALAREDYVANAAHISAAGASFAFTSIDTRPDKIISNIREMLAAGLDTTVALAALTTNAADLIGASRAMGSIESGKLGNLVLVSGPLFDEDSEIKHVLIEGTVFDIEAGSSGAGRGGRGGNAEGGGGDAEGLVGMWSLLVETPDGDIPGRLEVTEGSGGLRGWLTYEGVSTAIPIESITQDGRDVTFSFQSPDGFIVVNVRRSRDGMSGSATVDGGPPMPLTLERSNPD